MKMKGLLQSEYDIQSYTDYIAEKRKYFTIEGMMIEKHPTAQTLHEDPVPFLRNKYTSSSFIVSTKVAKDYIKTYEMEGGIICATDGIVYDKIFVNNNRITQPERVGILAYIKNNFLFIAYIWKLPDFEKIEDDPEKVFVDSFKVVGKWDYDAYRIVDNYNTNPFKAPNGLLPTCNFEYQIHIASEYHSCEIKKLKDEEDKLTQQHKYTKQIIKNLEDDVAKLTLQHEYTKQITKNLEEMFKIISNQTSEKNENSIADCFVHLYKCIDNIEYQEHCYQDLGDYISEQNSEFYERIHIIEVFVIIIICGMTSLIAFNIVTNIISQKHHNEPGRELVCSNNS